MITVRDVDVRVGARLLLSGISFHISPGDRIGLVGRNGAGKTTLLNTLAGTLRPAAGTITRSGGVGHLPQDSRAADQSVTVAERILSARGLDRAVRALHRAEAAMADGSQRSLDAYARAEAEFQARGGWAAEAEAARVAAGSGSPRSTWTAPSPPCPAGSAAGWSWPGSCSPTTARCCWTSPRTTWTPTRWPGCGLPGEPARRGGADQP